MSTPATPIPRKTIACIGAAHVDRMARAVEHVVMGSSNPVATATAAGGVARNVAETLAHLGCAVALYSVVGDDRDGADVAAGAALCGIDVAGVRRTARHPTASYTAVLDRAGELVVGLADMAIYEVLDIAWADAVGPMLADWPLWFVDANLPAPTIEHLLRQRSGETVVLADPVSAAKSVRLAGCLDQIDVIFPDKAEATRLSGVAVSGPDDAAAAAAVLRAGGVGTVVLSLGVAGVYLADRSGGRLVPPLPARLRDVTGAGDALVGGFIYGLAVGQDRAAVHYGLAAASLAVEADRAVPPDLDVAALAERLGSGQPA